MMKLKTLLVGLSLVLGLFTISCSKDDDGDTEDQTTTQNDPLSGSALLISKNWTSYKIYNSGIDVTSQTSSITYDFKSDNHYALSSDSGSSNGTWSLNGSTLVLDGVDWAVLEFTKSSLKIEDQSQVVKIYFN